MFDHQNRVSQVAQTFQDADQTMRVARVQADRRLIQNIERAYQMRAERCCQLDALRLAAREGRGESIERQIIQTDFVKKSQTLPNLFENFLGDRCLLRAQFQVVHKSPRLGNGHRANFGDGFSRKAHGARL